MKRAKYYFSKFPLYSNETPSFRVQPNQEYVANGKYNDYPDYLAYLYNNSGIHGSIVKGKSNYIFGKGWSIKKDWVGDENKLNTVIDSINGFQTLDELSKKAIFERTLYGGTYYLIEWGATGIPTSVKLLPYNTIRTDVKCEKFWYSKEWTKEMSTKSRYARAKNQLPDDVEVFEALDITKRKGKQVLFVKDENPASDIYPLPEYEQGKTRIETDIECGFFHLNNVKTGFAAGTLVTLFNGLNDDVDGQDELEKAFKAKTTGTDNAGEILINFQNPNTTAPAITPLRSNELDKQFEQLSKDTINQILYAHRVTNGLLFGVKTPGELGGGRSEFDLAWEHFCNTYVIPKQQEQEEDINYILSLYGIVGEPLELLVLDPIGVELTTDTIIKYIDTNSMKDLIYKKLGIERPEEVAVPKVLPPVNNPTPQFNKAFLKFTEDTILSKFDGIGESAENFEIVFEVGKYDKESFAGQTTDDKVISILTKNKKISVTDLAKKLSISEKEVYKILDRLSASNTIAVKYVDTPGGVMINTTNIIDPTEIELYTKWQYAGPQDDKNREFCKGLLSKNKLYTRNEINSLNNDMEDFNTDVWEYKGGWYTVPGTDGLLHTPQCRHYWNSIVVKRKVK